MSDAKPTLWSWRVTRLRDAFDSSFTRPFPEPPARGTPVLKVRIGGEGCVVRLADCSGVQPAPVITRLPTSSAAFRGVTSVRGTIVPVYDLAALLGMASDEPQLLLVSRGPSRAAFLVEHMDGYGEVPMQDGTGDALTVVTIDGTACRVVSLERVVEEISRDLAGREGSGR